MPKVFLKRQSRSELQFQHPFLGGWIFAAIGCGIAYFGIWHADSTSMRWIAIGMGTLFAAIGLGGALWRYELTLDLTTRGYRGRRGFWPSPRTLQGSLNELRGVLLTRTWRSGEDSQHPAWVVSLDFESWDEPVSFYETTDERKGYRKFEEMARLLGTSAIDRTGDQESVRTPDELDRSVADRVHDGTFDSSTTIEEPPPASGIAWTWSPPMIVLPAAGFNVGVALLALLGLMFLGFGALALASALGWSGAEVSGTLVSKWIVGGVFAVIGTFLCAGAIFGPVAREVISEDRDALLITYRAFGWHYRKRRLPRREIEDISIRPSRSARYRRSDPEKTEVLLRADDLVVRLAGDLPSESQRWLCRTLLALARR